MILSFAGELHIGMIFVGLDKACLSMPFNLQSESLVALEAAKAAEKSVLDEQVRTSQEMIQEKVQELSALQQCSTKVKYMYSIPLRLRN